MDDMRLKFYQPIVTGMPGVGITQAGAQTQQSAGSGESFRDVLQKSLEETSEVSFSKYAV